MSLKKLLYTHCSFSVFTSRVGQNACFRQFTIFFANSTKWWFIRDRAVSTDCYVESLLGTRAILQWCSFRILSGDFVNGNWISTFFRKSPFLGMHMLGTAPKGWKNISVNCECTFCVSRVTRAQLWFTGHRRVPNFTEHQTSRNELSVYCYIFKVMTINAPVIFHNVGRNRFQNYYFNQKYHMFEHIQFRFGGRGRYQALSLEKSQNRCM